MEPFIGQIQAFGFNFPPRGWSHCNGQLLPIAQNTALFSLLGTTFGGDGRTTFALPDLRGRSIVHVGSGPGLDTITWGMRGGSYYQVLTVAELPSHNHTATLYAETAFAGTANPEGKMLGGAQVYADPVPADNKAMYQDSITVNNTGGGQAFGIRNPFLGVYVSIAMLGLYPSRN